MLHFPTWKTVLVALVCVLGLAYAAPNLVPRAVLENVPDWLPSKQINLGLDLQGGVHLLLELEVEEIYEDRLSDLTFAIRETLQKAKIPQRTRAEKGRLVIAVQNGSAEDVAAAAAAIRGMTRQAGGTEGAGGGQGSFLSAGGAAGAREFDVASEGTQIFVTMTKEAKTAVEANAVAQAIEIVRRRIDELGTREPTIQRQGNRRIVVQVPGESDPERIKGNIGKTASMEFRLVDTSATVEEALGGRVPPTAELMPSADEFERYVLVSKRVMLTGDRLVDAQPSFDPQSGEPIVNFRFDASGARKFGDVTKRSVGRRFAIILDDEVISAPVIREPILGGAGQISGSFTVESANDLAILLRAGALPAPLTIIEERTVGPDLGADSIRAGEIAAVLGLAAVVVFMVLSYGRFGFFANIALLTNLILLAGVLSLLQATLTLPGIAGIVLTIGMAVDANVLIFERIREELAAGKTPINAVEVGYTRAQGTILDANITTLIAAVILFFLGSGPVRGFSVTLGIGILTSVFTAFVLCRLLIALWIRNARPRAITV